MTTGPDDATLARMEAELPPALERFLTTARGKVLEQAAADGYDPADADLIERAMRGPLLQRIADGEAAETAFAACYLLGRRALVAARYEAALAEGGGPAAAFARLVELEAAMAARLGEAAPRRSRALVEAGGEAAAAAAAEGATTLAQIETGFAMMRELTRFDRL